MPRVPSGVGFGGSVAREHVSRDGTGLLRTVLVCRLQGECSCPVEACFQTERGTTTDIHLSDLARPRPSRIAFVHPHESVCRRFATRFLVRGSRGRRRVFQQCSGDQSVDLKCRSSGKPGPPRSPFLRRDTSGEETETDWPPKKGEPGPEGCHGAGRWREDRDQYPDKYSRYRHSQDDRSRLSPADPTGRFSAHSYPRHTSNGEPSPAA